MPVAKQYGNRHLFLHTHCNNTLHPADCADDADFNFSLSGNSPPHRNLTDLVEFCFFSPCPPCLCGSFARMTCARAVALVVTLCGSVSDAVSIGNALAQVPQRSAGTRSKPLVYYFVQEFFLSSRHSSKACYTVCTPWFSLQRHLCLSFRQALHLVERACSRNGLRICIWSQA